MARARDEEAEPAARARLRHDLRQRHGLAGAARARQQVRVPRRELVPAPPALGARQPEAPAGERREAAVGAREVRVRVEPVALVRVRRAPLERLDDALAASRSTKSGAPSTTSVSRSTARTASGISLISAKRTAPPLPSESGRLAVRSTLSVLRDGVPAATRAQH